MTTPPPPIARWTFLLLFVLMAAGMPALAVLAFARQIAAWGWLTVIPLLAYETLVLNLGLVAFPDYRRRYLEFIAEQTGTLGLKALTRRGALPLDLARLYEPLYVDARFINQTPHNLLKMVPSHLRSGDHTLWDFLFTKNPAGQNFVIVGEPGSGKTTLLKHMAWSVALRRPGLPPASQSLLPVMLSLRDHAGAIRENPHLPLPRLIADHLALRHGPVAPLGWFEAQLEAGNCLVLLDGLNEIADPEMRPRVRAWVKGCLASYPRNRFIISSRLRDYRAAPLTDLLVLEVRPWNAKQSEHFARRWRAAKIGGRASAALGGLRGATEKRPELRGLAANPLLLTLLACLPQRPEAWPSRRADLFAAMQKAAPDSRRLPAAQRRRLLQWLAYHLMVNRRHELASAEAVAVVAKLLLALNVKASAEAVLKKLAGSTGVLVRHATGGYGFAHLALQEYLAAAHMAENEVTGDLAAQAGDLWWHETLRLYAAQTDASALVIAALGRDQPLVAGPPTVPDSLSVGDMAFVADPPLVAQTTSVPDSLPVRDPPSIPDEPPVRDGPPAGTRPPVADKPSVAAISLVLECLEETPRVQPFAVARCGEAVRDALDGDDVERRWVAEALLRARLRRLASRGGPQPLDDTLVTCAEYQLFLDEQRGEDQFFQPDHWLVYRFAPGEGQQPVVGVRSADAAAFCAWLAEREPGEWTYRLPTAREARDQAGPAGTTTVQGYWTASSAGERGGREHVIYELAWSNASRLTPVSEETLLQSMRDDLARDLMHRKAADSPSDGACNRTLADALNISRDLDHNLDMARDPTHDLESAQVLAGEIAATLALDLGLDVGFEFERARDRERNLGYDLSLAREPDPGLDAEAIQALTLARGRVRDRLPERLRPRLSALDLTQTRARVRALRPKLEHLHDPDCDLALSLDGILTRNLALALDRDLDRDLALAVDSDRALANALALSLNRAYYLKLARARAQVVKLAADPEREADRAVFEQVGKLIGDQSQADGDLAAALVQARDLALPLDVNLTLTLELARAHARDRERAVTLAKTLAQARDLARDSDRSRNRAIVRLVLLLSAILTLPAAGGAGAAILAVTVNSPEAVADLQRRQLSSLYFELYVDFVALEGRARGADRPFEGIRIVRAPRTEPASAKSPARGRR